MMKPKIINAETIIEAISKIEDEGDIVIHVREPEKRPLALQKELEEEVIRSYYQDITTNNELKGKISSIIKELKSDGAKTVIEEIRGVIDINLLYVKLYLDHGKLNASIITPRIDSKEAIHKLLIYVEIMLEDLSLSLGLANGTITLMTMKVNSNKS
ncbi:MAG: hypothetical protein QXO74_05000 [Candidatus Methanomethylicia archaeon]